MTEPRLATAFEPVPPGWRYTSDEIGGMSYRLGRWDTGTLELSLPYMSSRDSDTLIGETDDVEREYLLDAGKPEDVLEAIADLIAVLQTAAAHVKAVAP
jgi:hypothetical protein